MSATYSLDDNNASGECKFISSRPDSPKMLQIHHFNSDISNETLVTPKKEAGNCDEKNVSHQSKTCGELLQYIGLKENIESVCSIPPDNKNHIFYNTRYRSKKNQLNQDSVKNISDVFEDQVEVSAIKIPSKNLKSLKNRKCLKIITRKEENCILRKKDLIGIKVNSVNVKSLKCLMRKNYKMVHHCLDCRKYFEKKHLLKWHRFVHTSDGKYKCLRCQKVFKTMKQLIHHLRFDVSCMKSYRCIVCNKNFMTNLELQVHLKVHFGNFFSKSVSTFNMSCPVCAKTFSSRIMFKRHVINSHTNKKLYECYIPRCKVAYNKFTKLKSHLKKHHSILPETHNQRKYIKKETFSCSVCGKVVKKYHLLQRHEESHFRQKNFKCNLCNKVYSKFQLKVHMMTQHSDERPWLCSTCGKGFKTRRYLDLHMRYHEGKQYPCPYCETTFTNPGNLRRHIPLHTKEKQFHCEKCGKIYYQSHSLTFHLKTFHKNEDGSKEMPEGGWPKRRQRSDIGMPRKRLSGSCKICKISWKDLKMNHIEHMKIHKERGEKEFECNYCFKMFTAKHVLEQHIRTHTGEKPYQCSECGRCFNQYSHLKRHSLVHSDIKEFSCQFCHKSFKQKSILVTHMRIHTGEKPFSCNVCSRNFSDYSTFHKHKKIHNYSGTSIKPRVEKFRKTLSTINPSTSSSLFRNHCNESKQNYEPNNYAQPKQCWQPGNSNQQISETKESQAGFPINIQEIIKESMVVIFSDGDVCQNNDFSKAIQNQVSYQRDDSDIYKNLEFHVDENKHYDTFQTNTNPENDIKLESNVSNHSQSVVLDGEFQMLELEGPDLSDKNKTEASKNIKFQIDASSIENTSNKSNLTENVENQIEANLCGDVLKRKLEPNFLTFDRSDIQYMTSHSNNELISIKCLFQENKNRTKAKEIKGSEIVTKKPAYSELIYSPYQSKKTAPVFLRKRKISKIKPINKNLFKSLIQNKFHSTYHCLKCSRYFWKKKSLLTHTFTHSKTRKFECYRCKSSFKSLRLVRKHLNEQSECKKPYKCIVCGNYFETNIRLQTHLKTHFGDDFKACMVPNIGHWCVVCSEQFSNVSQLRRHTIKSHTNEEFFKCAECTDIFVNSADLEWHIVMTHTEENFREERNHTCTICGNIYTCKKNLINHLRRNHFGTVTAKDFKCSLCDKAYKNGYMLKVHMLTQHSEERPWMCSVCGKSFKIKRYLDLHMRNHSGIRYPCTYCHRTFSKIDNLRRHIPLHTKEKQYQCEKCGKIYYQVHSLWFHIKTFHKDPDRLPGQEPKKGWPKGKKRKPRSDILPNKVKLRDSESKTTSIRKPRSDIGLPRKPLSRNCKICNVDWEDIDVTRKEHMKMHRDSGETEFKCNHCFKMFTVKRSLEQHIRTHTGEKPFVCVTCGRCFNSTAILRRHSVIHSDIKAFECQYCEKSFKTKEILDTHIRTHTREKPFGCNMCDRKFSDRSTMYKHRKTHLKEGSVIVDKGLYVYQVV